MIISPADAPIVVSTVKFPVVVIVVFRFAEVSVKTPVVVLTGGAITVPVNVVGVPVRLALSSRAVCKPSTLLMM